MPIDAAVEREIRHINDQIRPLLELAGKVSEIDKTVAVMSRDVEDIKSDVTTLTGKVDAESETRMREREKDADTRKANLKSTIVTLLLCTGTVIAAVTLLLSAFGGHP